jgi:hypothetical protein
MRGTQNHREGNYGNTGYERSLSGQAAGKKGAKLLRFICGKARRVMQKTDKRSEQMSFYRFFNNERVTEEALTGCMEDHCLKHCAGLEEAVLYRGYRRDKS